MAKNDCIESLAQELYSFLSERFPICCSSDEFVFFPQALPEREDWGRWDDFSLEAVEDAIQTLHTLRIRITHLRKSGEDPGPGGRINASLLHWITEVLEEQLESVRHHAVQPTFIFTLATVGLVQGLQSQVPNAFRDRMQTLPGFLDRFRKALVSIPDLYREMGIEMGREFDLWIRSLGEICDPGEVLAATDVLVKSLSTVNVVNEFRLGTDLLERVVHYHTGSGLGIRGCLLELEEEIGNTLEILETEAGCMGYGGNWESAFAHIENEKIHKGDKDRFILNEIRRLRDHCYLAGVVGLEDQGGESIFVESLPGSLKPIRAADSYTAKPGYPFRGGIFYIFSGGELGLASESIHPVYRMTAAHEAYPGHHLLDMCRWNSSDPVRRPVEYPLFYEGWACFGEDLMLNTGAFDRDYDRLILARRRHRHAVRGRVDLLLHRGDLNLDTASRELEKAGFPRDRARETARKYALRPAYQMCYTIGRRRFQALYDCHGERGMGPFASKVLAQGEILFEDMEKVLSQGEGQEEQDEGLRA